MKKLLTLITSIIAITLFANSLSAQDLSKRHDKRHSDKSEMQQSNHRRHNRMGQHNDHKQRHNMICEDLNLSPQQQTKIDALKSAHKKNLIDKRAQLKKLNIDKRDAMQKENFSQAKKINEQIGKIKTEISNMKIDHLESIYKELNAEQREQLKNQKRKHRK